MNLRPATVADIPALLELMEPFNLGEAIPWRPARTRHALGELLDSGRLGTVLVAEEAPDLLGYAVVTYNFDLEWGGRDAFVTELFVAPEIRGLGIGRSLIRAAEAHARQVGLGALHLVVRPENETAQQLYADEGFRLVPRVMLTKPLSPDSGD